MLLYEVIAVGLILLYVLGHRMWTIRKQRQLCARLERVQQRYGY